MKVKKEVTIAVIIGLLIGVVVVGGVLRARSALLNMTGAATVTPSPSARGNVKEETGLFLTIDTLDNQVVAEPSFTISGKTQKGTYIVINGESGDTIITPNELGSFSQEITLVKGANTITITAYQEDGTNAKSTLTAVYSTAEI